MRHLRRPWSPFAALLALAACAAREPGDGPVAADASRDGETGTARIRDRNRCYGPGRRQSWVTREARRDPWLRPYLA